MGSRLLSLYHRLPSPARSVAATLRGWYLQWWRYGSDSTRLIDAALERDHWTAAQWAAWREQRLGLMLHRAATQVPYYRDHWAARRRAGDRASWELLEHWPLLHKDEVRAQPQAFVAADCDRRRMFHEQTSGTTGKPLDIWRARSTVEALYAIAAARTLRWDGIPSDVRWARLGGQLVIPVRQRRPPFWVWNAAMRQLYLSSYHLAPDLIPAYLDALVRYRIVYIAGYPSSLHALAYEALRLGRTDLRLRAVYTNAEPLTDDQRSTIAAAFHCPVRETYGMAETVAAASECPGGTLHQWPEVGLVENGDDGELICTGLLNPDMPLIRYRAGDRGRPAEDQPPCSCGRTLPAFGSVEGRLSDVLVTRDGRRVFWLNPVFYGLPIRESQIVQERLDRVRIRLVAGPEYGAATARVISDRLQERMGAIDVVIEPVAVIPRTANGKLRAVVCEVPARELAKAGRDVAVEVL
jgi:phenylacetate-CoA ligase